MKWGRRCSGNWESSQGSVGDHPSVAHWKTTRTEDFHAENIASSGHCDDDYYHNLHLPELHHTCPSHRHYGHHGCDLQGRNRMN